MQRSLAVLFTVIAATTVSAQDIPLAKILVEKEGWREFAKAQANYLEADPQGLIVYTSTSKANLAIRLDLAGKTVSQTESKGSGYLQKGRAVTTSRGASYAFDRHRLRVLLLGAKGEELHAISFSPGISLTALALWPDEGHLVVGVHGDDYLWAYRIEADGKFGPGDRYYSLRPSTKEPMQVSGITMDAGYLLYALTPIGIQVFDPTGRLSGVIPGPTRSPMTAIAIGGENADTLFVASGEHLYARKIQGKAAYTLKQGKTKNGKK